MLTSRKSHSICHLFVRFLDFVIILCIWKREGTDIEISLRVEGFDEMANLFRLHKFILDLVRISVSCFSGILACQNECETEIGS